MRSKSESLVNDILDFIIEEEAVIERVVVDINKDAYEVTVETKGDGNQGAIFGILINNGEVVSHAEAGEENQLTFEEGKTGTVVKIFWWESLQSMRPLCEAKTITIK